MSACQMSISGSKLNCKHCDLDGPGKCDPDGCAPSTVYIKKDKMCKGNLLVSLYSVTLLTRTHLGFSSQFQIVLRT